MKEDYVRARKAGEREYRRAVLAGDYPYLPALDDIAEGVDSLPQVPVGLVEVPLDQVAGTKTRGRTNAFARNFMPLLGPESEFGTKWSNLCDAQKEEGIRDPIKVYEYMWSFYVLEGNKRVSVAKFTGLTELTGDVIRIIPKYSEDREIKSYYEFMDYYRVAPFYEIRFSRPGSYRRLAEIVGQDLTHPWPREILENVRLSYHRFAELYDAKGGKHLRMTCGDAYLIYLGIYGMDSLAEEPEKVISFRIGRIWDEFLVESREDNIALATDPSEKERELTVEKLPAGGGTAATDEVKIKKGGGLFGIVGTSALYTNEHPLRVAFLYDRAPSESGWAYGHELGRNHLEQAYGGIVETVRFDECSTPGKTAAALEAAISDEDELIITTSPAMIRDTVKCAVEHPGIKFLNCSINLPHSGIRTYYIRMYEAKFLMGALAASQAENHRIGYLAYSPIYGTIADINAFAIGAAMIDPEVRIYLSWSVEKNADWRKEMWEEGIRIFSGAEFISPGAVSREYGIYKCTEDGKVVNLAAPVMDWGTYYERLVRTILEGTWKDAQPVEKGQSINYWWGLTAGVIDIITSEKLPYYSRKLLSILKNGLLAGTLNPFDGELRSQDGLIKEADSPRLTNEAIIRMDYLNDNVIGRIPENWELEDAVKKTLEVSGVKQQG